MICENIWFEFPRVNTYQINRKLCTRYRIVYGISWMELVIYLQKYQMRLIIFIKFLDQQCWRFSEVYLNNFSTELSSQIFDCCPRNFLIQEERIGYVVSTSYWITPVVRGDGLQRYSQSHQPHGSWLFHDFHWYNSCGTEKCPLAVNESHWQQWPQGVTPASGFLGMAGN